MPHSPILHRPIASIRIGERHRKDLGDIPELAASIKKLGLLQPIGIFPDGELVFGHRRLIACRDLGWQEIDVRIVDVESVIIGEMHENEMRKAFTPSERIAIFRSIETVKAGRPEKIRPRGDELITDTDKAAKLAGFAGRGTAYRAEKVVKDGIPELVEAMDKGEVTITAASKIAAQPRHEQKRHLVQAKAEGRFKPPEKAPKNRPPQKTMGQVLMERAARAAALPELTPEEKGYPPPELKDKQHPGYPAGVTYAMAWREENGRVQLWSQDDRQKMKILARFQEVVGAIAKLDVAELDELKPEQKALMAFSFNKVLQPLLAWLESQEAIGVEMPATRVQQALSR